MRSKRFHHFHKRLTENATWGLKRFDHYSLDIHRIRKSCSNNEGMLVFFWKHNKQNSHRWQSDQFYCGKICLNWKFDGTTRYAPRPLLSPYPYLNRPLPLSYLTFNFILMNFYLYLTWLLPLPYLTWPLPYLTFTLFLKTVICACADNSYKIQHCAKLSTKVMSITWRVEFVSDVWSCSFNLFTRKFSHKCEFKKTALSLFFITRKDKLKKEASRMGERRWSDG